MGRRVLIAADDEQVRRPVERALRFEGYEVATAGDGDEALRCVQGDRPDVVVLDSMRPRLDGMRSCRLMRAWKDRCVGYLRRKTEAGGEPRLIHTGRGVGYVVRQP